MKCPQCVTEGERSTVRSRRYAGAYDLPRSDDYWDEDGAHHSHNPNVSSQGFTCSRGHQFTLRSRYPCPSCGYGHEPSSLTMDPPPFERLREEMRVVVAASGAFRKETP